MVGIGVNMKYEIKTKFVRTDGESDSDVIIIDDVDSVFVDHTTLEDFVQFRKGSEGVVGVVLLAINKYDIRSIRLIQEDKNKASSHEESPGPVPVPISE